MSLKNGASINLDNYETFLTTHKYYAKSVQETIERTRAVLNAEPEENRRKALQEYIWKAENLVRKFQMFDDRPTVPDMDSIEFMQAAQADLDYLVALDVVRVALIGRGAV